MDIYPSSARPPELETTRPTDMLARAKIFCPEANVETDIGWVKQFDLRSRAHSAAALLEDQVAST